MTATLDRWEHFSFSSTASHHPSDLDLHRHGGTCRDDWNNDLPCPPDSYFSPPCSPRAKLSVSVLDLERQLSMHTLNNNQLPSPDEDEDDYGARVTKRCGDDFTNDTHALHHLQDQRRHSSTSYVSSYASTHSRRESSAALSNQQPLSPPTSTPSTPSPSPSHQRNQHRHAAPTSDYHAQSASAIRSQRQRAVRAQCSPSHLQEVSALVARMVEGGEQCRVSESRSPTPPSRALSVSDETTEEEEELPARQRQEDEDMMELDQTPGRHPEQGHVSEHEDEGFIEEYSSDGWSPSNPSISLRFRRSSDWGRDLDREGRNSCLVQKDARVRKRVVRRR